MATRIMKAYEEKGQHSVGNLNSIKVKTVAHGAIATEDVDNFTAVELGFNAEGERTFSQLTDVTKKTYLVAAPEIRYMGEEMVDFFNGAGDRARIVVLESAYTRFESSAFTLDSGDATATPARSAVVSINNGQVAHFDPTSKKFIVSASTTSHPDYATASAKFLVVANEEDLDYTLGAQTVRLEVQEA